MRNMRAGSQLGERDMEWQPIETLSKDEGPVLVFVPGQERAVFEAIATRAGLYFDPTYSEWDGEGATHWMPLPAPPVTD